MRPLRGAFILVLFLLLAAGVAQAGMVSISAVQPFAYTRSDAVTWKTNTTIEVNAFRVKANTVTLGSAELDLIPDSGTLTVQISRWVDDRRDFMVNASATQTPQFTMTNNGQEWRLYTNGVGGSSCDVNTTFCSWNLSSASGWLLSVRQPSAGSEGGSGEEPPAAPPPAQGGGGGGGGGASIGNIPLPPLPSPVAVFPRFSLYQWGGWLIGFTLVLNGFKRSRVVLPKFLRAPLHPRVALLVGSVILALLYLLPSHVAP